MPDIKIHLAGEPGLGAQPGTIEAAGATGHAIAQAGERVAHSALYLQRHLEAIEAHRQHEIKAASALAIQEGVTSGYQRIQDLIAQMEEEHRKAPVPSTRFYEDVNRGIADIVNDEVRRGDPKLVGDEYASVIQSGIRIGLLKHAETLSPELRKMQTALLKERNDSYLASREAIHFEALKDAPNLDDVSANIGQMAKDYEFAYHSGFLSGKDAIDRTLKYKEKAYTDWFERLVATDASIAARVFSAAGNAEWTGLVSGKDAVAFKDRLHKEQERQEQASRHTLDEKREALGKQIWSLYYEGKPVPPQMLADAQATLKEADFKELKRVMSERETQGGTGNERAALRRAQELRVNPQRYSYTQIGAMRDLNDPQRKTLFETKVTWEGHQRAALNDPNHFMNDKSIKFYADQVPLRLGVNPVVQVLKEPQNYVLSLAQEDFWKQYEAAYAAKQPLPKPEAVLDGITTRYRQLMQEAGGAMWQLPPTPPKYLDLGKLNRDHEDGVISDADYLNAARALRAWREREQTKLSSGAKGAKGGESLAPK